VARRSRAGGEPRRGGAQGQRRRAAAPEEEERRAAEEEKRRGFDLVRRRRSSLFWATDADAWARGQGTQGGSKISAGWRLRPVTLTRGPEIIFFKLKFEPSNA